MPRSIWNSAATCLALLAVLTACGGGGGGGGAPDGEEPKFTLSILSAPDSLLAGEPFEVTHRVAGDAGFALETTVLWSMQSELPDVSAYPERGTVFRNTDVPEDFTGDLTAPFTAGKIYLRAYARIEAGGNRTNVLSDEISIPVLDLTWTGPLTENVGLLLETTAQERLGGFGYYASDGSLHSLAGATWLTPDGTSLTVWFGDSGHPWAAATSDGLVFEFLNWTNTSADVRVLTLADGLVHEQQGVPIGESNLSRLRGFRLTNYIGKPALPDPVELRLGGETLLVLGPDRAAKLVKAMGLGISILAEAAAALTADPEWDDELARASAPLGQGTITTAASLAGDETIPEIDTALDAITCFTTGVCLSGARDALDDALDADSAMRTAVLGD